MGRTVQKIQVFYKRHYVSVVAFAMGVIIAVTFGLFVERVGNGDTLLGTATTTSEASAVSPGVGSGLPRSLPRSLRIPALDLETSFVEPLGLNADGSVEVPDSYDAVGWYKYGPTPGELGPAVILGHVDSYEGAAVFYSLGQLKAGDSILVERADGEVVTFAVERLVRHEQSEFPTAEVYGDLEYSGLRLVTCSGVYDRVAQRYSHNLIVFARMVEE